MYFVQWQKNVQFFFKTRDFTIAFAHFRGETGIFAKGYHTVKISYQPMPNQHLMLVRPGFSAHCCLADSLDLTL